MGNQVFFSAVRCLIARPELFFLQQNTWSRKVTTISFRFLFGICWMSSSFFFSCQSELYILDLSRMKRQIHYRRLNIQTGFWIHLNNADRWRSQEVFFTTSPVAIFGSNFRDWICNLARASPRDETLFADSAVVEYAFHTVDQSERRPAAIANKFFLPKKWKLTRNDLLATFFLFSTITQHVWSST